MKFEALNGFQWDHGNREKCVKHGVSRTEIEAVFFQDGVLVLEDVAHSQDEARFIVIGLGEDDRPLFVCFTLRETDESRFIRPISARYMHEREVKAYDARYR